MRHKREVTGATAMNVSFLDETKCELGEGPTYDQAQDKAWWFDIVGCKLFEHDFAAGATSVTDLPFMASMLGVVDENTQLIAADDGLYIRELLDDRLTMHHPLEAGNPVTRSNDGRVHPSGALWIGTMGRNGERGAGAIYWFFKGELRTLYPEITIPNSICFAPDGATAYFTDTVTGLMMRVPVDPANGLPQGKPRVHFDYGVHRSGLDGSVVDAAGNIWNACWGASCINVISAEGVLLRTVPVPVLQPSCPCFVGENLERLLVTTAWQGQDEARRMSDPDGGKTLLLDDIPVSGKPEPRIIL